MASGTQAWECVHRVRRRRRGNKAGYGLEIAGGLVREDLQGLWRPRRMDLSNATRGGKCQDTPVESEDPAEHVLNLMEAQLAFEIVTRRPGC